MLLGKEVLGATVAASPCSDAGADVQARAETKPHVFSTSPTTQFRFPYTLGRNGSVFTVMNLAM